jgi:hypothetical protein
MIFYTLPLDKLRRRNGRGSAMGKLSSADRVEISKQARALAADNLNRFAAQALSRAKAGDWHALASYLRLGGPIPRDMRLFIAQILSNEVKRPKGRKKGVKLYLAEQLSWQVGMSVIFARLEGKTNAVTLVAEEFKMDKRIVRRHLATARKRMMQSKALLDVLPPEGEAREFWAKQLAQATRDLCDR